MKFFQLLKKTKVIILVMLAVYILSFGAGYIAGKRKLADINTLKTSKIFDWSRNLELKIPGYGDLLQKYKDWERRKLSSYIFKGNAVKSMFLIFFNNWVVGNLTMVVRTVFILPLALYPYGRFIQGLTFAQGDMSYQMWGMLIGEFGGYFLTICGGLCVLFWTALYKRFGFSSRKEGLKGGLRIFLVLYLVSGIFILFGSYIEMLFILGMSLR